MKRLDFYETHNSFSQPLLDVPIYGRISTLETIRPEVMKNPVASHFLSALGLNVVSSSFSGRE